MRRLLPALLLVACAADEPEPFCEVPPEIRTYRVEAVELPLTSARTDALGVDLDGDGVRDNQAGNVFSAVAQVYPDIAESTAARLEARLTERDWLVSVATCEDRASASTSVPLALLADFADAGGESGWHGTSLVTLDLRNGRLSGALEPGYPRVVATGFAPYIQRRLDEGTSEWAREVDRDADGTITVDELLTNDVFVTLMRPDLDGDRFSFGFGVRVTEVDAAR